MQTPEMLPRVFRRRRGRIVELPLELGTNRGDTLAFVGGETEVVEGFAQVRRAELEVSPRSARGQPGHRLRARGEAPKAIERRECLGPLLVHAKNGLELRKQALHVAGSERLGVEPGTPAAPCKDSPREKRREAHRLDDLVGEGELMHRCTVHSAIRNGRITVSDKRATLPP